MNNISQNITSNENMLLIGELIFTKEIQEQFSLLSGDFNPIHLDKAFARAHFFGEPIAHGINVVMHALEFLLSHSNTIANKLSVNFVKPIFLDTKISFKLYPNMRIIKIEAEDYLLATINFEPTKKFKPICNNIIFSSPILTPKSPNPMHNACQQKSNLDLHTNLHLVSKCFPLCLENYGLIRLAELCELSYIVGMIYPGLNSLFSSFQLKFQNSISCKPNFFIKNFDNRFNLATIMVLGNSLSASVDAFFTPSKEIFLSHTMNGIISNNKCKGIRALIIGGSKGLGAEMAKLISQSQGIVTLTYANDKASAERLSNFFKTNNINIEVINFDCTDSALDLNFLSKFDHIYYFATPRIQMNRNKQFNSKLQAIYHKIYVEAFDKICEFCLKHYKDMKLFYPSSSFIDNQIKGYDLYIQEKLNGENVCEMYNSLGLRVYHQRLPKMLTQQSQSLFGNDYHNLNVEMQNVLDHMLKY
jgi:hypothetical protein